MNQILENSSLLCASPDGQVALVHDKFRPGFIGRRLAERINSEGVGLLETITQFPELLNLHSPAVEEHRNLAKLAGDSGKYMFTLLDSPVAIEELAMVLSGENDFLKRTFDGFYHMVITRSYQDRGVIQIGKLIRNLSNPFDLAERLRGSLETALLNPPEDTYYIFASVVALGELGDEDSIPLIISAIEKDPVGYHKLEFLRALSQISEVAYKEGLLKYYTLAGERNRIYLNFIREVSNTPAEKRKDLVHPKTQLFPNLSETQFKRWPYASCDITLRFLEDSRYSYPWFVAGGYIHAARTPKVLQTFEGYRDHEEDHPLVSRIVKLIRRVERSPFRDEMPEVVAYALVHAHPYEEMLMRVSNTLPKGARHNLAYEWAGVVAREKGVHELPHQELMKIKEGFGSESI